MMHDHDSGNCQNLGKILPLKFFGLYAYVENDSKINNSKVVLQVRRIMDHKNEVTKLLKLV